MGRLLTHLIRRVHGAVCLSLHARPRSGKPRNPPDFCRGLEMNYVYCYASCPTGMITISVYCTDSRVRSLSKRDGELSIIFIALELKQLRI